MDENLTRRQAEFVTHLVQLNRDLDGPIHYSVLADDLGVSPFTAYDMLRLLETKGLVTSTYQLPEDRNGPGRAERVFYATDKGREHRRQMLLHVGDVAAGTTEFSKLELANFCHSEALASDLVADFLARLSRRSGVTRYGIELVPLVALRLHDKDARSQYRALFEVVLPLDRPATVVDLTLLGGCMLAFLAGEVDPDPDWLHELTTHIRRFQAYVLTLSGEEAQKMGVDIGEAMSLAWANQDDTGSREAVTNQEC